MANRYAIANGGNWNTSATWATSELDAIANIGGASIPTSADDVFLVLGSGNITIDANANCRSLDCTGYIATLTHNFNVDLNVGDASGGKLIFAVGMTYTLGNTGNWCDIFFKSTTDNGGAGWAVDLAGKQVGTLRFEGVGGKWVMQSNFQLEQQADIIHTGGHVDFNNISVDTEIDGWGDFSSTGTNVRRLTLGSTAFSPLGSWTGSGSNLTIDANTATISLGNTTTDGIFNGGSLDWNGLNVILNGYDNTINNGGTIGSLTQDATTVHFRDLLVNGDLTMTGTLTLDGNAQGDGRITMQSGTFGSAVNVAVNGSVIADKCDFQDISAAGTANWNVSTTHVADRQGNSGITFPTSRTLYAVGSGARQWSESATWATSSGGAGGNPVPLAHDDVVFDGNSNASSYSLNVAEYPLGRDITFTDAFTATTLWQSSHRCFGSIRFNPAMTDSFSALYLFGRGTRTIESNGSLLCSTMYVYAANGTYTLLDDLQVSSTIEHRYGTFDSNGFDVTVDRLVSSTTSSGTRALVLDGSTINLEGGGGNVLVQIDPTNLTASAADSTFYVATTATTTRGMQLGGLSWGTIDYSISGSTGELEIDEGATLEGLRVHSTGGGRQIEIESGSSGMLTITGDVDIQGADASNRIILRSSSSSTKAILSKAAGIVSINHAQINDIQAEGGATWNAYNSIDGGDNTGINFLSGDPPSDNFIGWGTPL